MPRSAPAAVLKKSALLRAGFWTAPPHWYCVLYDEHGQRHCDGNAYTAAEAMAWIGVWAPDALMEGRVEPGEVPFHVPDGWRFELTPQWVPDSRPEPGK